MQIQDIRPRWYIHAPMGQKKPRRGVICCSLGLGGWLALGGIASADAISQAESGEGGRIQACCEIWGQRHDPETVRLEFARASASRSESVTVYGDGVVILDGRTQHRIAPERVQDLLGSVERSGFRGMEEMYGAGPKRVRAHASLTLGEYTKQVVRLWDGTDPEPLTGLVDGLFQRLRPGRLGEGMGADDLEEALRRIADGSLSPRTLRLIVLHRAGGERGADDQAGRIVRVHDGWLETERLEGGPNRARPVQRRDTHEAIRELADALVAAEAWSLPANLLASDYTQLTVEALRHRHTVLARPFARRDPESQAAERERLQELLTRVHSFADALRPAAP